MFDVGEGTQVQVNILWGCTHVMHNHSRIAMDPRTPTMLGGALRVFTDPMGGLSWCSLPFVLE